MKIVSLFLLIFILLVGIVFPYFNIYFSKIISGLILIIAIILLIRKQRTKNVLVVTALFSFLHLIDFGVIYNINYKKIYMDDRIFVCQVVKPWNLLSCGATYVVFEKKYLIYYGYEVISNQLCQEEIPKIEYLISEQCYLFYVDNNYQKKIIRYCPKFDNAPNGTFKKQ